MSVLWVFLGGAAGGVLRYLLALRFASRDPARLAPGLIAANLLGSLALGVIARVTVDTGYLLWGTGLCGGLTTFSTFAVEVLGVLRTGRRLAALLQAGAMIVGGVGAAALGLWLGGLFG
ncbi:MAG: CrcB family protein [Propionibacterium sp.]|nr:CrcB family protein [Propionibacterium sp.]